MVRNAFLRFFVKTFQNYDKYIIDENRHEKSQKPNRKIIDQSENDRFRGTDFLNDLNLSDSAREFLSRLVSSQMFERFIEERIANPEQAEVLFFDESIIAKNNRSKSKNLKAGMKKKPTPFLDDQSGAVSFLIGK